MLNIDRVHARWNLQKCIQFVAAACYLLYADVIEFISERALIISEAPHFRVGVVH